MSIALGYVFIMTPPLCGSPAAKHAFEALQLLPVLLRRSPFGRFSAGFYTFISYTAFPAKGFLQRFKAPAADMMRCESHRVDEPVFRQAPKMLVRKQSQL